MFLAADTMKVLEHKALNWELVMWLDGNPLICTDVSMNPFSRSYDVNPLVITEENIFPSTFRREIGLNWLIISEVLLFRNVYSIGFFHSLLICPLVYEVLGSLWCFFGTLGHICTPSMKWCLDQVLISYLPYDI